MKNSDKAELNVYFNSACPVCNAGINLQKGRSTSCAINWNDVHSDNHLATEVGKDLETIRKYLHLTNEAGELKVGIDAFIELWQKSPKERWKATLFSLPLFKQFAELTYFVFANFLYRWNLRKKHWKASS